MTTKILTQFSDNKSKNAKFGTQVSVSNEILTQIATNKCEKLEYWYRFLQATLKMVNHPFMFQFFQEILTQFSTGKSKNAKFSTQVSVSNEILTQIATNKCENLMLTFHISMSLRLLTLVSKLR